MKTPTSVPATIPAADKSSQVIFPHASDWGTTHGAQYLKNTTSCTTCHGAKLDGGSTGVSCTKCHASYPHIAAWAKPGNHGAAFAKILNQIHKDEGDVQVNECVMCHKPAKDPATANPRSASNVQCNSCHVGVPHNVEMVARNGQLVHHSEFGRDKALQAACLSCHREHVDKTRNYMPTFGKCTACHYQPDVKTKVKWMSDEEAAKVDKYLEELRNPTPPATPTPAMPPITP